MKARKPVMAEPVGAGRWWNVRKLPTGEVLLQLDPGKIRMPILADVGWTALKTGFTYVALSTVFPALGLATAAATAVLGGRSLLRRHPTSWELAPGRATLRRWNGKVRGTYAPFRVVLTSRQHWDEDLHGHSRPSYVSYALFLETRDGKKVAIHRGVPARDRHELARAVGEALGVAVVEAGRSAIQFGIPRVKTWSSSR
ncbi:MAG TPA: hypothetical protein VIG99_00305 [Myxococcaceae bacterium]